MSLSGSHDEQESDTSEQHADGSGQSTAEDLPVAKHKRKRGYRKGAHTLRKVRTVDIARQR